jgi:hypothetical protein
MTLSACWMVAAIAGSALTGCGGTDAPLGGPYGGTTRGVKPILGSSDVGGSSGVPGGGSSSSNCPSSPGGTVRESSGGAGPNWTQIYNNYLSANVFGACPACHNQMHSASDAYMYLSSQGYIQGASSTLVQSGASCLSWYSGNMPPQGGCNTQAVSDMSAWAAAGALNN